MANVLCMVSYKIFPARFGGQKGIAQFYEHLSRYEHLTCLTVRSNDPAAAPYDVLNRMGDGPLRYINIFYFFVCRKLVRRRGITCVIIEHPYLGWLALLLKRFCRVKLIVHSHNIEAERFKSTGKWWWRIMRLYEQYVHRHADFTFCKTDHDRNYFIQRYQVAPDRVAVITFGIPEEQPPAATRRLQARRELLVKHALPEETVLYLFNGALDYAPNLEAVLHIVEDINPLLISKPLVYRILICGKGLPPSLDGLKKYADRNILHAGFVDDIGLYLDGTDVFINPVTEGGGIKTKLVEALAHDLNAVSTVNGAQGIDPALCGDKLVLSGNDDWPTFSDHMYRMAGLKSTIPPGFFRHFNWDHIAKTAAAIIDRS